VLVTCAEVKRQACPQVAFSVRFENMHSDKICTYCLQT